MISADSTEKSKRGRPPVMSQPVASFLSGLYPDRAPRQLVESYYQTQAHQALGWRGDDQKVPPDLRWLYDGGLRSSILAELGRIEDADALREIARQICELKPKSRAAIAMIRRYRRGESPRRPGGLTAELTRTVNDYLARHPSMSWEEVQGEIEDVLVRIEWSKHGGAA